jgi:hypothetical protein
MDFSTAKKIEDSKLEYLVFVIDLSKEILEDDFYQISGSKITRYNLIFDEILNFCKLKDYVSNSKIQFSLYTITDSLNKVIPFSTIRDFDTQLSQCRDVLVNSISLYEEFLDLGIIFKEGVQLTYQNKNSKEMIERESITRFILFYNRYKTPVINSIENEFNTISFHRLKDFCLDCIFIRKKTESDEEKKLVKESYSSLMKWKTRLGYYAEVSRNVTSFKFWLNLLMANANQRIKNGDVDKHQKKIQEIINNSLELAEF